MYSGLIGKIDKAHRYAEERSRFDFRSLTVTIHGDNGDHNVSLADGAWHCDCDYFRMQETCAHTMSLEVMLDGMVHPSMPSPVAGSMQAAPA